MKNKPNILKPLARILYNKEKCKNKGCNNIRKHCSAYCEECSKLYGK